MKTKTVLFFLLLFGVVGYCRERFFEHLNIIMIGKYRNIDEYSLINLKMPAVMAPFNSLSYNTLYYSKYVFTLLWTLLFFSVSYFAIKKLGSGKNLLKFLAYSYAILLILAGISMAYGLIINNRIQDEEYTLSRWLLGVAQSPIICLILLASQKLHTNTTTNLN